MTKNEILKYLKNNKLEFKTKFDVVKIGLFGSYAIGKESENSDIDILVVLKKDTKDIYNKKLNLKKKLENHFNKKIDIASEKFLKPYAREQILSEVNYV